VDTELIDSIVEELFVNGNGDRAQRLVLMSADGHALGGWSEAGLRNALERAISGQIKEESHEE
jgi:hypothetical protein